MTTFSTGSTATITLDEYDTLAITGSARLQITSGTKPQFETISNGTLTFGPFGAVTTVVLNGLSLGTYLQAPSNIPVGVVMIDMSAAQIAAPTAAQLAATNVLYQLNAAPYTIYQSNGTALVGFGGGVSAMSALSDVTTYDLPANNTPLLNALAGKADALAATDIATGAVAITRATHLNRPLDCPGTTTATFAATATSGALKGDAFECQVGTAGSFTATGAITAKTGYTLTAGAGVLFTARYDAADDAFYSTTPSATAGASTVKTINTQFPNYAAGATPSNKCIAVIPIPALGTAARVDFDLRLSATTTSATAKNFNFYLSATADTVGNAGAPVGTNIHANTATWTGTSVFARLYSSFQNMGSQSVQNGPSDVLIGISGQGTAPRTAAINTAVATYMNVYLTAAGTDLVTLNSVVAVAYDPAGL